MEEERYFNGIPFSQFCLIPGDWDIHYKDKGTFNTCIMRYVLEDKVPLKKFNIDGLIITKVTQVR